MNHNLNERLWRVEMDGSDLSKALSASVLFVVERGRKEVEEMRKKGKRPFLSGKWGTGDRDYWRIHIYLSRSSKKRFGYNGQILTAHQYVRELQSDVKCGCPACLIRFLGAVHTNLAQDKSLSMQKVTDEWLEDLEAIKKKMSCRLDVWLQKWDCLKELDWV